MKKLNLKFKKNRKGITLIALVITIIVLLILAGVTIATLTGDNGILIRAKETKDKTELTTEKEAIVLSFMSREIDNQTELDNKYNIGEMLYDRNLQNSNRWSIVVLDNGTIYGTGWNYIPENTEIINYGKTKYSWLVNHNTGEFIHLEKNKYTKFDYNSTLAITDNLALNIDPTNISSENWNQVTKYGDVNYNNDNKSIQFNMSNDLSKEGGYLKFSKERSGFY